MLLFSGTIYILLKCSSSGDEQTKVYALAALQKGNVLAWKHILLHGEYDLSQEFDNDEFGLGDPKIVAGMHTRFWEA